MAFNTEPVFNPPVHTEQLPLIVPEYSLILPAYNEGTRRDGDSEMGYTFRKALDTYSDYLQKEFGRTDNWELIVVDDGSVDEPDPGSTIRIAEEHGAQVIVNPNGATSRRGGALKIGFQKSRGRIRTYTDSDASYSPATLYEQYENVASGESDISVAYRADSEKQYDRTIRKYGHKIIHGICESKHMAPTGVKDPQAGAKTFSAAAAVDIWSKVQTDGWAADRESLVIARVLGYTVSQVGADIEPHEGSSVKIVSDSLKMIRDSLEIGMSLDDPNTYHIVKNLSRRVLNRSVTVADYIEAKIAA
jgi:dolichyl-phosphate beta-glucosyltransferase